MVKRWYGQRRGQCLLTLSTAPTVSPAPDDSSHVWRRRPTGASTSHTRQQLPGSSCPSPARLLKHDYATLAPGRRARSREGHDEERTEAHDTGAIDCKKEELEVPMGTVRLVPSSSTFRAPIWTRARTPRCDLRSSTLATPSAIMRTRGAHHHRRVLLLARSRAQPSSLATLTSTCCAPRLKEDQRQRER